jgi:hypothetical protein
MARMDMQDFVKFMSNQRCFGKLCERILKFQISDTISLYFLELFRNYETLKSQPEIESAMPS